MGKRWVNKREGGEQDKKGWLNGGLHTRCGRKKGAGEGEREGKHE